MTVSIPQALQGGQGPVTLPHAGGSPPAPVVATGSQAAGTPTPAPQPSSDQIQKAVEHMKQAVGSVASNLQFSVDEGSGQTVIRVVDGSTNEVIRQIPSEEMLQLAQDLTKMQGMLLKQKA